ATWYYQSYFRAGPMPGSSWPTQNEFKGIFVDFWSHFIVLALFVLWVLFGLIFIFVGILFVFLVFSSLLIFLKEKDKKNTKLGG
ncbi:hypothetical protein ACQP3J_30045, partial [Escherichia coli]